MRRLLALFLLTGGLAAGPAPDLDAVFARERALEALQDRMLAVTKGEARCEARLRLVLAPRVVTIGLDGTRIGGDVVAREALVARYAALCERFGFTSLKAKVVGEGLAPHQSEWKIDLRGSGGWMRARLTLGFDSEGRVEVVEFTRTKFVPAPKRPWFTDVTKQLGLSREDPPSLQHPTLGLAAYGAAAGDVNNDGRLDIVVAAHDGNAVYLGRAGKPFQRIALPGPAATAPLLLDFDNDGDTDVFFSNNGPQRLLENRLIPDGRLAFRDVSRSHGVAVKSIGFAATAGDVNGDGRPDIYVAAYNNYGPVAPESWDDARNGLPNLLFVSQPGGIYKEQARKLGVADSRWSYGAQFLDIDEDGDLDLYVANDFGAGNALFLQLEDGGFSDRARAWGVLDSGYAMGVSFGDYDNDGAIDLHVTRMSSNAGSRLLDLLGDSFAVAPRLRHLSAGNGLYRRVAPDKFEDVSATAGPFRAGWAWGGGFWDFDNDGYQDLFVPNGHMSGTTMRDT